MRFLLACGALAALSLCLPAQAQEAQAAPNGDTGYFADSFRRVNKTQAEQPHWITPVATTTPRLEEEFRFDTVWQTNNQGITAENYGGGKGLEFIPFEKVEVILSLPSYIAHKNPAVRDGFGDFQFLLKYRLLSRNEESGNYILTAFLGVSLPTGQYANGATDAIITPTIAYGKGFGDFDLQGTLGMSLPAGNAAGIGKTIPWNNALQYRVRRKFWPEVELNYTHFQDGKNDGKTQMFVTPGLVIGKLRLWKRLGLTFGGGFQIAATRFHTTDHNGILSVRFPF
jgi:Putative MetA-pathway of phenol degradation